MAQSTFETDLANEMNQHFQSLPSHINDTLGNQKINNNKESSLANMVDGR